MASFQASLSLIAALLDLPEGCEIVSASLVDTDGGRVMELEVKGGPFPEGVVVIPEYTQNAEGRVWMSGFATI